MKHYNGTHLGQVGLLTVFDRKVPVSHVGQVGGIGVWGRGRGMVGRKDSMVSLFESNTRKATSNDPV